MYNTFDKFYQYSNTTCGQDKFAVPHHCFFQVSSTQFYQSRNCYLLKSRYYSVLNSPLKCFYIHSFTLIFWSTHLLNPSHNSKYFFNLRDHQILLVQTHGYLNSSNFVKTIQIYSLWNYFKFRHFFR